MSIPKCLSCHLFQKTLFRYCNPAELDMEFSDKRFLKLKKGDVVFSEGDEPEAIYCIFSGTAKITKKDAHGHEHIMRFTRTGEIVGIHAIVGRHVYFRSAVAVTDLEACCISKTTLETVISRTPALFFEVMKFLCTEVEQAEKKMDELRHLSARQRLAAGLLQLREVHGLRDDRSLNLEVPLDDLANYLNTNRSSLYKLLNEFKTLKLVAMDEDRIRILQESRLRRVSRS